MKKIGIAFLSAISADDDGWYQLLPAGYFKSRDGRPFDVATGQGWYIDGTIAARLIEDVRQLGQDVCIDYEHNQRRKDKGLTPEQMVAAGWFNDDEMQWREGQGLFIHPRLTPAAKQRIADTEFGYLSAVFPYDTTTGAVLGIRMAALTNDPGATGMQKLAALAAELTETFLPNEDSLMNKHLRDLLARLGIALPETATELTDEQAQAALSAVDGLKTDAAKVAALSAELTTAKAAGGAVDLTKYVPIENYNAVRQELADALGKGNTASLSALLDKAQNEGRIFKSERTYMEQLGGQIGVAALSAQLDARQPVAALAAMQTTTSGIPSTPKKEMVAELSADEKATVKALGITEAQFIEIKKNEGEA